MNIGQVARQAGGTADRTYEDIEVVVVTSSGKVRQVASAEYRNGQLVLRTGTGVKVGK